MDGYFCPVDIVEVGLLRMYVLSHTNRQEKNKSCLICLSISTLIYSISTAIYFSLLT